MANMVLVKESVFSRARGGGTILFVYNKNVVRRGELSKPRIASAGESRTPLGSRSMLFQR